ncbi:MAG TPA: D-alanyl-D-alanine carboxypeptidase family protein [Candidatus Binataceae bacterium]|jgi:D-alanyl-D-alanine carboxypeptidase (penicillin-binding protein 5/6)|nr:D-alanyl-D-alanine carboxypeptidase family protein [Candidatus Binataceae bacterium]
MLWAFKRWKLIWAVASVLLLTTSAASVARHYARPSAPPPVEPLRAIRVLGSGPAPFALDARAAMLTEFHSGEVLYAYNEHVRMQPASLAKIMTFYIALEALKNGKLTLDTGVTISEKAWRLSIDQTVSKMFLQVGQQVPVKQLLYGLMVSSGNDAAMALAEYLGGSEEGFVPMMNDYCHRLGLNETRFASPDGLPEPDQYTTAADMVKLATALLKDFPSALDYTSVKEFTFDKITQRNWNTLLLYDARVDGLKTGHVDEAGFHLVATGHQDNVRLISAVMGAPNAEKRRTETEKLLAWAFRSFVNVSPDWSHLIPASLPVYEGDAPKVAVAPPGSMEITLPRGEEKKVKLSGGLDVSYLVAPVAIGTRVGSLTVSEDDRTLLSLPVETQKEVGRGGIFRVLSDKIALMFHRLGHLITSAIRAAIRKIPFIGPRLVGA